MTGRSVGEWIGSSPDAKIPPRVRLRVYERANGRCEECTRKLLPGDAWQADHVIALVNGGENREGNLRCVCDWCHKGKTAVDLAEKSRTYRKRARHAGVVERRPWHPTLRRKLNGTVVPKKGANT